MQRKQIFIYYFCSENSFWVKSVSQDSRSENWAEQMYPIYLRDLSVEELSKDIII